MKKFTFKGVLDGFRSSVQVAPRDVNIEIQETLRSEHFQLKKTFRHGFPFSPTALAWDPIQKLLAIGDKAGNLRIVGGPGVDAHVRHETGEAVLHARFLINEGALVTHTADDHLHLWNFRQKVPKVVHSLKFQRERITCLHLPLQSKWLHVGTERGNVHVVHIETFVLSGYVINWNKMIEPTRANHPGCVVDISDNPMDPSKLLVAFECGLVVVWDLRTRTTEWRAGNGGGGGESIRAAVWRYDAKHVLTAHADGALATWSPRIAKPVSVSYPHAKANTDGKLETCKPIHRLEWKNCRNGEGLIIFSGGLPTDRGGKTHSITVINGKSTTLLEMEHAVIDFITLSENPWNAETEEPYAIVVLLQNDLVVIDLTSPRYPPFENPYPMDIHESPVTCCTYLADCPSDLIPAFYSVGRQSSSKKQTIFSEKQWPIDGGEWSPASCSYNEIILTGHADGSVKFWDASAGTLQILYKLKTSKVFERGGVGGGVGPPTDECGGVQLVCLCPESRRLAVALANSHVLLFKFRKHEISNETYVVDIPVITEPAEEGESSPDCEGSGVYACRTSSGDESDLKISVRGVNTPVRKAPGFQASLVCLQQNPSLAGTIASLTINSSYGLVAWGGERGIIIVDIVRRVLVAALSPSALYTRHDQRSPSMDQATELVMDEDQPPVRPPRRKSTRRQSSALITIRQEAQLNVQGSTSMQQPTTNWMRRFRQRLAEMCSYELPIQDVVEPEMKEHKVANISNEPSVPQNISSLECLHIVQPNDKLDSSFSRSRSSSMSSLENISSEGIQCIAFAESYIKKTEPSTLVPTLWIGTTVGSVLTLIINLPETEKRATQQVEAIITGSAITRLKGSILTMSFLDCNGALIPYSFECWKDDNKEVRDRRERTPTKQSSSGSRMSPTLASSSDSPACADRQFVVVASEKQARVLALPSQNTVYRQQISDTDFVVKSEIVSLKDSVCLVNYISTGHLIVFSLPSLRPLYDVEFLPLSELSFQTQSKQRGIVDPMLSIWGQQLIVNEDTDQISRTFCFSNKGHGLYLASPSELQKFTIDAEFSASLNEMMGELFLPREMPEAPKEGFFKGLFGGGSRTIDRDELFGESSGKPNRMVAVQVGAEGINQRATGACSEISRAHLLAVERGEKLGQLEDKAERMHSQAQEFGSSAHSLMLKYKDKKWYQL